MILNYFFSVYDIPPMSKLKKTSFSIYSYISVGQMSRKRVHSIVILRAMPPTFVKNYTIVYHHRSKQKCLGFQQSILPSFYTNMFMTNDFFTLLPFYSSLFSPLSLSLFLHPFPHSLSPWFISNFWNYLKHMGKLQIYETTPCLSHLWINWQTCCVCSPE